MESGVVLIKSIKKIFCRIGRRGRSLLFFGFLYTVMGQSYYTAPINQEKTPAAYDGLWAHLQVMPLSHWGVLWMVIGVACLVGAFYKRIEDISFGLTASLMTMWAAGFGFNYILGHGYRSYIAFAIYGAFAAFILLISGWPEEGDRHRR